MTGWQSIDAALEYLGLRIGAPTPGQTTGGQHASDSEHYQGRARDYGDANSDSAAIAQALLPYAQGPNAPIDELFFSPLGIFYKNGQPITPDDALRQEHYDHVHVGIRPGVDLAAVVESGGGAGAQLAGFPGSGIIGGVLGGAASDLLAPVKHYAFTAVFVAGAVGLVVLGAMRTVKGASSSV